MLSLGANLPSFVGAPEQTIRAAVEDIDRSIGSVRQASSLYKSTAVTLEGQEDIPDFINACVLVETSLTPAEILQEVQAIERAYGRKPAARWSARPLDLDLIGYGDLVLPDKAAWRLLVESDDPAAILEEPVVPHPRAHQRGFVLAPLKDVAPKWVHPVLKKTVAELYEDLYRTDGLSGVWKIPLVNSSA